MGYFSSSAYRSARFYGSLRCKLMEDFHDVPEDTPAHYASAIPSDSGHSLLSYNQQYHLPQHSLPLQYPTYATMPPIGPFSTPQRGQMRQMSPITNHWSHFQGLQSPHNAVISLQPSQQRQSGGAMRLHPQPGLSAARPSSSRVAAMQRSNDGAPQMQQVSLLHHLAIQMLDMQTPSHLLT